MKLMYPALTIIFFMAMSLQGQGPATWSNTETYTHPSLVIDGNGVSYLSVKNVTTAGTPLSNTEYWATLDSLVPKENPTGQENLKTPDVSTKPSEMPDGVVDGNSNSLSSTRLTGISTRGPISSSNNLTPGILIEGTESKKVVFMAKGYSMFVSDGVENYADDLVMTIYSYNESTKGWDDQGTYDDFGDVTASTTTSGATVENVSTIDATKNPEITLPKGAKEAAVVLTLPPGYHAAIASSKSATLQEGVVEAYEVK